MEELGADGFAYGREEGLRGKTIRVIPRQEDTHLFHTATGERLPD
ncbi:hypothetical protein OG730_05610 [Streptomyces sp. NBC_01298]|nr:hypothetical protein OG730_05610 [Streptomyces sp. NBC_01298]